MVQVPPNTSVFLTGVFLKAEQGLLMLPKIFLGFGTVTHLDYRIATGPPT